MVGGVRRMRGLDPGRVAAVGAVLLAVAGCHTTVQEQLGMGKRSPDEFQVVRRAPLIVPPEFRPAGAPVGCRARRAAGRGE